MHADPLLQLVVALSLAVLFAAAAWHKSSSRSRFAAQLAAYDLLPATLVVPAAAILPLAETAVAIGLLFPAARPAAALAATLLLMTYAVAMLANLLRGRRHIDCGCGGPPQPLSAGLVLRNVLLTVGASLLLLPTAERTLAVGDLLLLVFLVALLSLSWAALGQIFHNAGVLRGGSQHEP